MSRELPEYSAVREQPHRGLPPDLAEEETGTAFRARSDAIERSLLEAPHRPQAESPLFVELVAADEGGVVTFTLPDDGSPCLAVFSSPVRAADYIQTQLATGPAVNYLWSSPLEFITLLQDLRDLGIAEFALDRCPRCDIFTVIGSESITSLDDAMRCWAISKATERARLDLYLDHARRRARSGELEAARDVALETVAHVSPEDPRAHLLLGQIALTLGDRTLLREGRAFLEFFELASWGRRLDDAVRSGSPDFDAVG
jgi:hypothetical protein